MGGGGLFQLGAKKDIKTIAPIFITDYFVYAYIDLQREILCLLIKWPPFVHITIQRLKNKYKSKLVGCKQAYTRISTCNEDYYEGDPESKIRFAIVQ